MQRPPANRWHLRHIEGRADGIRPWPAITWWPASTRTRCWWLAWSGEV